MSQSTQSESQNSFRLWKEVELCALLSHQLRSPLHTIRNSLAAVLENAYSFDGETQELLNIIDRSVDRMTTLTERCLMLLKIQNEAASASASASKQRSRSVDLRSIIKRAVHSLDDSRGSVLQKVKIEFDNKGTNRVTMSDGGYLLQHAVANLLANALQYGDNEEHRHSCVSLMLSLAEDGDSYWIIVTDHGPGIPEDLHEEIFKPFYRVPDARLLRPSGTGLGLALVRLIVDYYGGAVGVNSVPGQGSTFWLQIPVLHPQFQMRMG